MLFYSENLESVHIINSMTFKNAYAIRILNALSPFQAFRQNYSLNLVWPVPVEHVTLFIAYCFELGYSPATIMSYMSGNSFHHKSYGFHDTTAFFIIRKLLEGFRRARLHYVICAPITRTILIKVCNILPSICYSHYECNLFQGCLSFSIFWPPLRKQSCFFQIIIRYIDH